jgi:hypothetical protein
VSGAALVSRVCGGQVTVVVRRDACPPQGRPCGRECPFQSEAEVARVTLAPAAPRLRVLADLSYRSLLADGSLCIAPAGATAQVHFEVEGEGPGPCPVRAVEITVGGHARRWPGAALCQAQVEECRCADLASTGRVAPRYAAAAEWRAAAGDGRGSRRIRPPGLRPGAHVVQGPRPAGAWIPLQRPAGAPAGGPPLEVVWRDAAGLERARLRAAAEPERESAFLLLGAARFDPATRRSFTEVVRVEPVTGYEARNAHVASIAPESLARARRGAAEAGLEVVGVLHSHVLETAAEVVAGEGAIALAGLFYSTTDGLDHDRLFPSAWSIGGVLNLRRGGAVEMGVFARDERGRFASLEGMVLA